MSDGNIFKVEKVFIKDSVEGRAGNTIQPGTKPQSENTLNHVAAGTASMETAVDKHRGISQRQCHDTAGLSEVSSGFFTNRASVSEDRSSPTNSADLFPTPTSSRESILSEGSDREKSWSAVQLSSVTSPVSFSGTVSPCSSVLSGIFSPAIVQIKRHFLAPGSSLIDTPQTCFSSCESLSSSVCPQSPPPRHRPPLTRLSLLTAILRKGRLPVLSPTLQRPYTPCWPVSPVTLSFCNACSAASSVASIPLEFSSQFSSSLSRVCPQTQVKRYSEQIRSSSAPRWEQVISPLAVQSSTLTRTPLPVFCSNFESVSPPKHEETDCATPKKLQHTHTSILKSPELKSSTTHTYPKGNADNNLKKLISPSSQLINQKETSAPQKWNHRPNSSLSRLHLLSQQLRSSPSSPTQLQSSRSPGVTRTSTASPLPYLQNTAGSCESGRSWPDSKNATPHKAHCLSPSRYTPIAFSGWLSPTNSPTPTPTPTPTPSPAPPPIRDLTPSPSLSLRSTPSPRPGSGISDCSDREGKKRKVAALLAICMFELRVLFIILCSPHDILFSHMCSPAQLRQQSEELYAVIDEILANSIPEVSSSNFIIYIQTCTNQNNSSFPKSLGRETKYVSRSDEFLSAVYLSVQTKPGVIRPMTAIPRMTVGDEEEFHPNPFSQSSSGIIASCFNMEARYDGRLTCSILTEDFTLVLSWRPLW
uniref:Uncharacterized protein n=1 Tax=Dicentrarchus labrax TaxID=13489 RepID=A0A8C4IBC3_DICLA